MLRNKHKYLLYIETVSLFRDRQFPVSSNTEPIHSSSFLARCQAFPMATLFKQNFVISKSHVVKFVCAKQPILLALPQLWMSWISCHFFDSIKTHLSGPSSQPQNGIAFRRHGYRLKMRGRKPSSRVDYAWKLEEWIPTDPPQGQSLWADGVPVVK